VELKSFKGGYSVEELPLGGQEKKDRGEQSEKKVDAPEKEPWQQPQRIGSTQKTG